MRPDKRLVIKVIPIVRMDCPTCIPLLENEVKRLKGVEDAHGSYMTKTLKVTYDPDVTQLSDIEAAIEHVGYQVAYKRYPNIASRIVGVLRREKPAVKHTISDVEFPEKVLHASKPVAVLFSSPTCPTCRVIEHVYNKAAADLGDKADLYEMDITSTDTWRQYGILTVPTILVFRNGQVAETLTSIRKEEIERALGA